MTDRTLLIGAAALEIGTGFVLMVSPSVVAYLLINREVVGAGLFLGRLGGVALLSLGVACWPSPASVATETPVRSIRAMLIYNFLAAAFLIYLRVVRDLSGVCLWPAIIVHSVLAFCFVQSVWKTRSISV